jgi:hypothetical protein
MNANIQFHCITDTNVLLQSRSHYRHTAVGANLCARDPLEVKGHGIRGLEGGAGKEAYTVHTTNIISQRQYFAARCLSSYVTNVFGLHSICVCFPSARKLVT